jgi:hypothetical protein
LVHRPFVDYFERHGLHKGDQLWLEVVEPKRRFRISIN